MSKMVSESSNSMYPHLIRIRISRCRDLEQQEVPLYFLPIVNAGHDVIDDVKTTVARHVVQLTHNSSVGRDYRFLKSKNH